MSKRVIDPENESISPMAGQFLGQFNPDFAMTARRNLNNQFNGSKIAKLPDLFCKAERSARGTVIHNAILYQDTAPEQGIVFVRRGKSSCY